MTAIIDTTVEKVVSDLFIFLEEHPEMKQKLDERDDYNDEGFFEVMAAFHEWSEAKLQMN